MALQLEGGSGDDRLVAGTDGGWTLLGRGGNDTLRGAGGADRLDGGDGSDLLIGGVGADMMIGGMGDDRYWINGPGAFSVIETRGGGYDTIIVNWALPQLRLPDQVEAVELRAAVTQVEGNTLDNRIDASGLGRGVSMLGGSGNDHLTGGAGADRLDGGRGADILEGGGGDDVFIVDHRRDRVTDAGGNDLVLSSINYTLGAGLERLELTGRARIGTGNDLDNTLAGNRKANRLTGGNGEDRLFGGAGNDVLRGGNDDDLLHGGAGKDKLFGGQGEDVFRFTDASDTGARAGRADRIMDFEAGDIIDLSAIDADSRAAGQQSFTYVGAEQFSGQAGELRFSERFLRADLDGDMRTDLWIWVDGRLDEIRDALLL